jgi:hypothetical protein
MKLSSKRSARVEKSLNYLCKTVNYPFLARVLLSRREYVRLSQRFAEKEDFSVPTLGAIIGLCQAAKCDCRALRPRACRGALRLVLPSQCGIVMEKTSPLTSHRISQVKYQLSSRAAQNPRLWVRQRQTRAAISGRRKGQLVGLRVLKATPWLTSSRYTQLQHFLLSETHHAETWDNDVISSIVLLS